MPPAPSEPSPTLHLSVLGPLRAELAGREVHLGGARRRRVLLRLLATPNQPVATAVLAEDVWDGQPPDGATSTLQSHVSALRQLLGPDSIRFADGGYRTNLLAAQVDQSIFEESIRKGRACAEARDLPGALDLLEQGLALWRGTPLVEAAGAPWVASHVAGLEELRASAVEASLEARLALGQHYQVCALAEQAVGEEPFREGRWALWMLALYRSGRQAEALRCFQRLRAMLVEELGIEPSPALSELERDILDHSEKLSPPAGPDRAAGERHRPGARQRAHTNLPAPVASFVGRTTELRELNKLLLAHRLVTIVGSGGAGKTRLALELAGSLVDDFRDGVWLVGLSAASDRDGVLRAFTGALGVSQPFDEPSVTPWSHMADMRALVVVDNCEHVVDSAAEMTELLLEAAPGLRVLATSREPLRLPGESVWTTPPISTPQGPDELDRESLAGYDAVRLFVERAAEAGGLGDLGVSHLRTIARICLMLDGLPLAVELVAARVGALGLDAVADRLDDVLGLASPGSRTLHSHHQTIDATIAWSVDLLEDRLQDLVARLSIFAGSFSPEAAHSVVARPGESPREISDDLSHLAERSLLVVLAGSGGPGASPPRYRMLSTVGQFAARRLGPEVEAVKEAHCRHYVRVATDAAGHLSGVQQGKWLTALELDHADIAAAIAHLLEGDDGEEALLVVVALERFWHNRGHLDECRKLIERSLEVAGDGLSRSLRTRALNLAGQAACKIDLDAATSYFSEALVLAEGASDDDQASVALAGLAGTAAFAGQPALGKEVGAQAIERALRTGNPIRVGEAMLAYCVTIPDDLSASREMSSQAIAVTVASGDRIHQALAQLNLGNCLLAHHEIEEARRHFESAKVIFDELGSPDPMVSVNLGWVHLRSGDPDLATPAFAESLRLGRRYHEPMCIAYSLLGLACCVAATGQLEPAARLLGLAEREVADCGHSFVQPEQTYRNEAWELLERELGPTARQLYEEVLDGPDDDLIDLALSIR